MVRQFLFIIFFGLVYTGVNAAVNTFDWKGTSSSTWESSSSWDENGSSSGSDYPGSGGRTTDIVRFGKSAAFTYQPKLSTSLTIASIEFCGGYQKNGTQLTVNGATLTVGTITQDINTTSGSYTIFDYFYGTGTISCASITVGSSTATNGANNFLLSDIATLDVSGNITVIMNVNNQNGSGFRLENGNMYLSGQVIFTKNSGITASNAAYFTINTITQATPQTATTPHLYLSNIKPVPSIPSPNASVNFYGDHGGTGTVTYTAASPDIVTTSTAGFGSGGGTIDTSKASYDNLVIQATGTATVGGTTVGALKVAGDMDTYSNTTFSSGSSATNTSVGGNWNNTATVNTGSGSTAVTGNVNNSGPLNLSTGILEVGGNLTNSSTLTASSGNITVDGSLDNTSTLTLSSGNLTVSTNYTNTGTFTAGSGTVYFNGSSAQSLTDNSTSGTTLNNVDFTGSGTKTLSGTGSFAVSSSGVLSMGAGSTLATGGILTLNSSSTGSATVAAIPSTAQITGTVNVQRYISGGSNSYRGYRLLSSAVYTASSGSSKYYSLSYLTNYAPVTGTLGTSGGLTKVGNPSMYLYRDNVLFTNSTFNTGNFRGINKINNSPAYAIGVDYDGTFNLTVGTGVMFFYRGNLSNISTKYITTTSAEPNLFVSTGTLNQQSITVTNWYTGLNTLQYDVVAGNATGYAGYNLVGNPYASSIDWNTFSKTSSSAGIYGPGTTGTIYILNEVSKQYATYNGSVGTNGGSNVIPSGQGFFVQASASGASLTFNESAKTNAQVSGPTQSTGTTLLLSTAPVATNVLQYLRLQMVMDSVNTAETIIQFNNRWKNTYDPNEDSQYLPGTGEISLNSITADKVPVAINNIPFPKQQGQAVPLDVEAAVNGTYSLNMTEIKSIPKIFELWLMDRYKSDSLDMRANQTYRFDVSHNDTSSFGKNRFSLVIRQNSALAVHLLSFGAKKQQENAMVIWTTENEENYTNFTVERSSDGGATFADLGGFLSSAQGSYSYLDKNPPLTTNLYRLKITDLNGTVSFSNPVTLSYGNGTMVAKNNISIFPNPTGGTINLAIGQNSDATNASSTLKLSSFTLGAPSGNTGFQAYDIKIISITGMVVRSEVSANASWQSNVSSLPPGTYVIQVLNDRDKSIVGKGTFVKI